MKRAVERWRSHKIIGRDASEGEGAGWDGTMRPVAVGTEIEKMKTRMFGQLIHQRACRTGEVGGASGQRHYRYYFNSQIFIYQADYLYFLTRLKH